MGKDFTPFWWMLFGAGGTVAALLFPVHIFLTGLAFPLGWLAAPSYESLHALVTHPITRLYLFVFISLPLFHWAHRFRYAIYDLFQVKHPDRPHRLPLLRDRYGWDDCGGVHVVEHRLTRG